MEVVPDSGCTISCIPEELARKHHLKINPVDDDEPEISTYGGATLSIVGQTRIFLTCVKTKAKKMLNAIVIRGAAEQTILLS